MKLYTSRNKKGTKTFVFEGSYHEREIPKQAGFWWNAEKKVWWTYSIEQAYKLYDIADQETKNFFDAWLDGVKGSYADSSDFKIPVPDGEALRPYQIAGVERMTKNTENSMNVLLADDMGLGKTIQALACINTVNFQSGGIEKVLVLCPANVKVVWQREAKKWLMDKRLKSGIKVITSKMKNVIPSEFTIVNYDIINRFPELLNYDWDLMICDEAHYISGRSSRRSKVICGGVHKYKKNGANVEDRYPGIKSKFKWFTTGTPDRNRTIDLWNLIHTLDPKTWKNFMFFAKRYCDAEHNGYGWDFTGASNTEELQLKLRSTIMISRKFEEVVDELPDLIRQFLVIPENGNKIVKEEKKVLEELGINDIRDLAKILSNPKSVGFSELSKLRRKIGLAKTGYVKNQAIEALRNHDKITIFFHHHDVGEALQKELDSYGAVLHYGKNGETKNAKAVELFQENPNVRVILVSITSCEGITLTAGNYELFAELTFVPKDILQAEKRQLRIGQDQPVIAQSMVFEGSVEERMVEILAEKTETHERLTNPSRLKNVVTDIEKSKIDLSKVSKKSVQKMKKKPESDLTEDQKDAVLEGCKRLAGVCDGAIAPDGCGFNALDTNFGKSLASRSWLTDKQAKAGMKMLMKYHGQLGDKLMARIKNEEKF